MTIQIALGEKTNDIIKKDGGGIERVSEGRYIVQAVRSKLQTGLGEWLLDSDRGWIVRGDLSKNYNVFDIEVRARIIIEETPRVNEVLRISSSYKDRRMTISFTANTDYGEIDLTVPWGNV